MKSEKPLLPDHTYECPRCHRHSKYFYDKSQALKKSKNQHEEICVYCYLQEIDGPLERGFYVHLRKTENNLAAIYKLIIHEDFVLSHDGFFPYNEYYLSKEIYDTFINLESFEDYECRYHACRVINAWEGTIDNKDELDQLRREARERFGKEIVDKEDVSKSKSIEEEIVEDFEDKLLSSYEEIIYGLDSNEKKQKIEEFYGLLDKIREGTYDFRGQSRDISNMAYDENWTVSSYILDNLVFDTYYYEFSRIKFEYWELTKENKELYNCLDSLVFTVRHTFGVYEPAEALGIEVEDTILGKLEQIITIIVTFYNKYERMIEKLERNKEYRKFLKIEPTKKILIYEVDKDGNLTYGSLAITLRYAAETLFLIHLILHTLNEQYESLEDEESYESLLMIRRYTNKFRMAYIPMINALYASKDDFSIEANRVRIVERQLNRLIETISKLEEGNLTKEKVEDIFLMKKTVLHSTCTEEEQDTVEALLNKLIISLVTIINKKSEDNPIDEVYKSLENDLGQRVRYLHKGNVIKTLATAEYLYDIFVGNATQPEIAADTKKDYSCISIMYYKALEGAINEIIYKPYREKYLKEFYRFSEEKQSTNYKDYFVTTRPNIIKKNYYLFHNTGTSKYLKLKEELTLGNLAFFLDIRKNKPKFLMKHLEELFGKDIDTIGEIGSLSSFLHEIKDNRNIAAHGGEIINLEQVREDKTNVYIIEDAMEYKRVLYRFVAMLQG